MIQLTNEDRLTIVLWAASHSDIKKVWLYGSRARGEAKENSIIDLAIETAGESLLDSMSSWKAGLHTWRSEIALSSEAQLEWYSPEADLNHVGDGVKHLLYKAAPIVDTH